ncbi:MAG: PDZ domain-containing protein [Pirellulales bacterium]
MLRIQTFPALLAVVTFLGATANAQLFRRDDPATEKAKQQQQQQRTQSDPRQKTASQPNKTPNAQSNNNLNNQSNRAGQINRNNSSAQPNKVAPQKNLPQNAGPNGRLQASPQTRPGTPQSAAQQSAAQQAAQRSQQQGARGTNQNLSAQQQQILPSGKAVSTRPGQNFAEQNLQQPGANGRPAVPQINAFAPSPVGQPGFPQGTSSAIADAALPGTPVDNTIQLSDPSNSNSQINSANGGNSSVSEAEIVDRFGIQLNPNVGEIVIARVKPDASAATAGLRVDDKVTSIGGAPVTSRAEFYEIARLLSVGDQIEIEFERAGKTEKSVIQYGTSATQDVATTQADNANQAGNIQVDRDSGWTPTKDDRTAQLEKQVIAQQRIIQDLQERIRQLEADRTKKF